MHGQRLGRTTGRLVAAVVALGMAILPVGALTSGSALVATPIGAVGSTVYLKVANLGVQPATAGLNVYLTSGSTTLVGSASTTVAPLSTTVVAVPMSGSVSTTTTLSLSSQLVVGITETADPF